MSPYFARRRSRGISQLKILAEPMHRSNYNANKEEKRRPCDVFDTIGGTGNGGFIATLLVVFGLTADQSLEELIHLAVSILGSKGLDAEARTTAIEKYTGTLLEKYDIGGNRRLLGDDSIR